MIQHVASAMMGYVVIKTDGLPLGSLYVWVCLFISLLIVVVIMLQPEIFARHGYTFLSRHGSKQSFTRASAL